MTQVLSSLLSWRAKKSDVDVERAKLLSSDEQKFREALLTRIEMLEAHDAIKTQRILELEGENRLLRMEIASLKAGRD